jgi:RNA polymerase sigma-70 factor (ECF subfamily)
MPGQTLDNTPTDGELLAGAARGDEASLAALYDRYHVLAFSLALRVVNDRGRAEDVVQDAFLSVWRKAGSYVEGRGSVKTWLTSVVRNRAIDLVRARRGSDRDDEATLLALRDPGPGVLEQVTARLDRETIRTLIGRLPREQRRTLTMAYFEGLSHSEIATATGIPLGTVKSRVRLGMHRLRDLLLDAGAAPTWHPLPASATAHAEPVPLGYQPG